MMNRLRCTWTQLRQEPFDKMLVFQAFAEGEQQGEKVVRESNKS